MRGSNYSQISIYTIFDYLCNIENNQNSIIIKRYGSVNRFFFSIFEVLGTTLRPYSIHFAGCELLPFCYL